VVSMAASVSAVFVLCLTVILLRSAPAGLDTKKD
jgi:hypothetical protein